MLFFLSARRVSSSSSGLSSTRRIGLFMVMGVSGHFLWQREMEAGTLAHRPLGPYAAPVAVDDSLDRRKTDSGPGKLLGAVKSLEGREELFRIGHIKTRPVVSYGVDPRAILLFGLEQDAWVRTACGEFPGVPKEILENRPNQSRVPVGHHTLLIDECDGSLRLNEAKLLDGAFGHAGEVERLTVDLRAR